MQLFIFPGPPDSNTFSYTYKVIINNVIYKLHFIYNSRQDSWSVNFLDNDDNILVAAIKLRMGVDLLSQYKSLAELPDVILVVYNEQDRQNPNSNNFGKTAFLGYIGAN